MPTFEQNMEAMSKMSSKEKEEMMAKLTKMCICGQCPTYIGTGEKRLLFCSTWKSTIIKNENGCICPTCPVTDRMGLKWVYYCTKGSGREQAGMK